VYFYFKIPAMYTYTMTFVSCDNIGLPADDDVFSGNIISGIVTEKLNKHELELADFNWSGAYSFDNSLSYLMSPYKFNFVVEVRVKLDVTTIQNRQAIYDRCLEALKKDEVLLKRVECLRDDDSHKEQCVLCFDIKSAA